MVYFPNNDCTNHPIDFSPFEVNYNLNNGQHYASASR